MNNPKGCSWDDVCFITSWSWLDSYSGWSKNWRHSERPQIWSLSNDICILKYRFYNNFFIHQSSSFLSYGPMLSYYQFFSSFPAVWYAVCMRWLFANYVCANQWEGKTFQSFMDFVQPLKYYFFESVWHVD